jgi:hypothetical protein
MKPEYVAPTGAWDFNGTFLQRFRSYGAMVDARRRCQCEVIVLRRGESRITGLLADFVAVVSEPISALPTDMFKAQENDQNHDDDG